MQIVGQRRLSASLAARRPTQLAAANDELNRSQAAVQARYDLAIEAIKTFHTGVSEDFLLKEDQFKELRDRLLKSAADFYGKLGALLGNETDLASRRALAQSNFELADLTGKVGRDGGRPGGTPRGTGGAGGTGGRAGGRRRGEGRRRPEPDGRRRACSKRRARRTRRCDLPPVGVAAGGSGGVPTRSSRAALAACRSSIWAAPGREGQIAEALVAYRLARADQEALAAAGASNEARRDLADTVNRIGAVL